jgi:hypothetical protein
LELRRLRLSRSFVRLQVSDLRKLRILLTELPRWIRSRLPRKKLRTSRLSLKLRAQRLLLSNSLAL